MSNVTGPIGAADPQAVLEAGRDFSESVLLACKMDVAAPAPTLMTWPPATGVSQAATKAETTSSINTKSRKDRAVLINRQRGAFHGLLAKDG